MKRYELSWREMALIVGVLMALCKPGHKLVGSVATTPEHALFAVGIVGLFGALVGFLLAPRASLSLKSLEGWYRWGPIALGVGFILAIICAFNAFRSAGAHMGANTFISGPMTILPSLILGGLVFKEKLDMQKSVAVTLSLMGAALVTDARWNWLTGSMPAWVFWSLGTCLFASTTRFIAKQMATWGKDNHLPKLNGWVMVFWAGAVMALLSIPIALILRPKIIESATLSLLMLYALMVAIPTIGWWIGRFVAYQKDAPLGMKEIWLNGTYQSSATVLGLLFFGDSVTILNGLGMLLCIPAILLAWSSEKQVSTPGTPARRKPVVTPQPVAVLPQRRAA